MAKAEKNQRQNVLPEELKQRAQAERGALNVITTLASSLSFEEKELEMMLQRLMIGHYNDAVEERSIAELCGYPLCSNNIGKASSKQKFHISLEAKKIYDMDELQMFCSVFCYKANNYLKSQLPTEPVWMRSKRVVEIKFLHINERVDQRKVASDKEIVFDDFESLGIDHEKERDESDCSVGDVSGVQEETGSLGKCDIPRSLPSKAKQLKSKDSKGIMPDVEHVKRILIEWTQPSQIYKASTNNPDAVKDAKETLEQFSKSPQWISSMLSHVIEGQYSLEDGMHEKAQISARRRIVKEKLHNSLRRLLCRYNIPMGDVWKDFTSDLSKYHFSKENIVLKPSEWNVVSFVLLKRLAKSNLALTKSLEASHRATKEMLLELNITDQDIELLGQILALSCIHSLSSN